MKTEKQLDPHRRNKNNIFGNRLTPRGWICKLQIKADKGNAQRTLLNKTVTKNKQTQKTFHWMLLSNMNTKYMYIFKYKYFYMDRSYGRLYVFTLFVLSVMQTDAMVFHGETSPSSDQKWLDVWSVFQQQQSWMIMNDRMSKKWVNTSINKVKDFVAKLCWRDYKSGWK